MVIPKKINKITLNITQVCGFIKLDKILAQKIENAKKLVPIRLIINAEKNGIFIFPIP